MRSGSTPSGDVGTVFSGQGIEMVWVSKPAEPIDQNWFSSDRVDLILVVQGQLKFEFESSGQPDRVLSAGEVLVLPAGQRCRAYRWPRDRREATVLSPPTPPARARMATERAEQGYGSASVTRQAAHAYQPDAARTRHARPPAARQLPTRLAMSAQIAHICADDMRCHTHQPAMHSSGSRVRYCAGAQSGL